MLHVRHASQVVCFPCNQFGAQESGSSAEIRKFVADKYGSKFKMMEKIEVNGANTHPVYTYLKGACDGCQGDVRWNFAAKFIIDKNGAVVERNGGSPAASEAKIKALLAA